MVDKSLNFGRHLIRKFLSGCVPYSTVLDIGAGQGADLDTAKIIAEDAVMKAVEVYPLNVRILEEKGVAVHAINIETDRFPFDDDSIDVIIANQILEHTKEVFWIFNEISRILPVGGRIIVGVPNLASLHNRLLLMLGRQPTPIKTNSAHIRGFTKIDIVRFLEEVFPGGYKLVSFGGSNFYPFPPAIARPLAMMFPNMAWGIFLMFEKQREYNGEFLRSPVENKLETNFYVGE